MKALVEARRRRRRKNRDSRPPQPVLNFGKFRLVGVVAALIIAERMVYRHGYQFALGVELSVLKVCLPPALARGAEDRFGGDNWRGPVAEYPSLPVGLSK